MCKYLTYKTAIRRNFKNAPYCRLKRQWLPTCENCEDKAYKELKPIKKSDKPIKQYSKKRAKAERERYSIFTNDLKHCIENKDHEGHIDKHECLGGKNRLKSMKYGLVVPLCRSCHENEEIIQKWQVKGRQAFTKEHGKEMFIKEFQTRKGVIIDDNRNKRI